MFIDEKLLENKRDLFQEFVIKAALMLAETEDENEREIAKGRVYTAAEQLSRANQLIHARSIKGGVIH